MRRDWPSLFLSGSGQPNVRANNVIVRARAIHFAALVSVAALVWVGQSGGAGQTSSGAYKPLSSLGHLQPAPYAGKLGPELTPIPNAPLLAEPASAATPTKSIDGIKCEGMERMVFHIHAHLVVVVNGKYRVIPYGVGIGPPLRGENTKAGAFVTQGSCFSWIHTHAADGIIHLEGPAERTYTLGEFFDIWGQPLSANEVGPAHGAVTAIVNGMVYTGDPRQIPLLKHAQIQLEVGRPLIAPVTIKFYGSL
jgi:hypothetical protein